MVWSWPDPAIPVSGLCNNGTALFSGHPQTYTCMAIINSISREVARSRFVTIDYTLVGHLIVQLGNMLVTRNSRQTTRSWTLRTIVHVGTDITICNHNAEIHTQAFCFQLHTQTMHGHSKQLGRSRLGSISIFSADQTCTQAQ